MSLEQLTTITAIKQFLAGTQAVAFGVLSTKKERYSWVQKTLVKHRYMTLGKIDKGSMTRYLMKVTGYSLAQIKRLIRQYVSTGTVKVNGLAKTVSNALTVKPISGCWRVWMNVTVSPAGQCLKSSANVPLSVSARSSINSWRTSLFLTCTTYERPQPISGIVAP